MRIEFKDVKFRNFLSYGSTWTTLTFKDGLNFVISSNEKRSNTIGKTSCLKSIAFGLFGKLSDISQKDIINWQNKKNCEVYISFTKKDDLYLIKRGLKPNYLEIYINDVLQPQESDVRITQKKLEDEILEINFDIFNSLIFCNPNNSISILNTTAQKKREFIESLFSDMTYFVDLLAKTKEKLKKLKENVEKNNNRVTFCDFSIKEIEKELKDVVIPNIEEYHKAFLLAEKEYNKVSFDGDIDVIIEEKTKEKEKEKLTLNDIEKEHQKITNDIWKINEEIKLIEKELEKTVKYDEYKKEVEEINSKLSENNFDELITNIKEVILFHTNNKKEVEKEIYEKKYSKAALEKELPLLKVSDKLKNGVVCPTCKNEIDLEKAKSYVEKETERITEEIAKIDLVLNEFLLNVKLVDDTIKANNDSLTIILKSKKEQEDLNNRKSYLESLIKESNKEELLNKKDGIIEENTKFLNKREEINALIDFQKNKVSLITTVLDELNKKRNLMNNLKSDLQIKKMMYDSNKEKVTDILNRVENKKEKLNELIKEKNDLETQNYKLNDLCDYFEVLKESLRDENIKSYIINNTVPFINQKCNEMLSELGFNFFIEFDSWLNLKINGPGSRYDCSLSSMSGAEAKSIDLITKLVFLDLAKAKAKTFPDLIIFDEAIDSSFDDVGVDSLLQIIKYKQSKDNLKIYIVSHRKEINDIIDDEGSVIKINKKDNFSFIEEV